MQTIDEHVQISRKIWRRNEAHLLADMGLPNAGKLELIEGDLIDRAGKKQPHVLWQTLTYAWLSATFGAERVRPESPIDVADEDNPRNEPEPDLVVTSKSVREYNSNPRAEDILLLIEVSDSTLLFDMKVKARLYARAGILEYWVIDIPQRRLIVHRSPVADGFAEISCFGGNQEVSPLSAPDSRFCLDKL